MEAWYGIMGLRAVCHTLDPRLSAEDIAWIADHGRDTWIMAVAAFLPLLEQVGGAATAASFVTTYEWRHATKVSMQTLSPARAGGLWRHSSHVGGQLFAIQKCIAVYSATAQLTAACSLSCDAQHN
jgi:acyl-CoA synthetase (AMP-forming)/AMP-acid ligase II